MINIINNTIRINKIAQGIPLDAVDSILDFIDTIWTDLVAVLILTFLETVWEFFLNIFIDLAPAWGFAFVVFGWCYIFYIKYISPTR